MRILLKDEEGPGEPATKSSGSLNPKLYKGNKKKEWSIVMGDSWLQGTMVLICWPDQPAIGCCQVCCMLGSGSGILWTDYLSLFNALMTTPCCYSTWAKMILLGKPGQYQQWLALEAVVKVMAAHVVFSSIQLVRGMGVRRAIMR